jgi:hypothetical protein
MRLIDVVGFALSVGLWRTMGESDPLADRARLSCLLSMVTIGGNPRPGNV